MRACLIEGFKNPYSLSEFFYDCVSFCINLCLLFYLLFKSLILSVDICIELIGPLGWGFLFFYGVLWPWHMKIIPTPFRFTRVMSTDNAVLPFKDNLNLSLFFYARDFKHTCLVSHCVEHWIFLVEIQWQIKDSGSSDRRQECCLLPVNQPAKHTHTHCEGEQYEKKAPVAHFETNARSRVDFSLRALFTLFSCRPCVTQS